MGRGNPGGRRKERNLKYGPVTAPYTPSKRGEKERSFPNPPPEIAQPLPLPPSRKPTPGRSHLCIISHPGKREGKRERPQEEVMLEALRFCLHGLDPARYWGSLWSSGRGDPRPGSSFGESESECWKGSFKVILSFCWARCYGGGGVGRTGDRIESEVLQGTRLLRGSGMSPMQ